MEGSKGGRNVVVVKHHLGLTAPFFVHIFEAGPQEVGVGSPVKMLGQNAQRKKEG